MVKFPIQNDIWKYSETKFLPVGWRHRLQIARNDVCTNLFFFFFLYEFCVQDISKMESAIISKFSQYLCHDQEWIQ